MNYQTYKDLFSSIGEPTFRLKQFEDWVYRKGVTDPNKMTNLSESLRERISTVGDILSFTLHVKQESSDGQTIKYSLKLRDGKYVEMVIMKHKKGRKTVCVSSQVGCPVGCEFCATGKLGLIRNLTTEEIVDQVIFARGELIKEGSDTHHVPTNIVFMGMGEPLLNSKRVFEAIEIFGKKMEIGGRRLTISTSGVPSKIDALADMGLQVNLAISLHSAIQEKRDGLIPFNAKFPLKELILSANRYTEKTNKKIFYEYVMIEGRNDSIEDADAVISLLSPELSHINLIPYNPIFGMDHLKTSPKESITAFQRHLEMNGFIVTHRFTMGDDISAACGQLAGEHNKEGSNEEK